MCTHASSVWLQGVTHASGVGLQGVTHASSVWLQGVTGYTPPRVTIPAHLPHTCRPDIPYLVLHELAKSDACSPSFRTTSSVETGVHASKPVETGVHASKPVESGVHANKPVETGVHANVVRYLYGRTYLGTKTTISKEKYENRKV